jgi:hypothetical protein
MESFVVRDRDAPQAVSVVRPTCPVAAEPARVRVEVVDAMLGPAAAGKVLNNHIAGAQLDTVHGYLGQHGGHQSTVLAIANRTNAARCR